MKFWKSFFILMIFVYGLCLLGALQRPSLLNWVDMVINTFSLSALFGLSCGKKGKKLLNKRIWQVIFIAGVAFELFIYFRPSSAHSVFWYLIVLPNYVGVYLYAFQRNYLWQDVNGSERKVAN